LQELFSEYGTILDIVAKKNLKAKGQAFIVFDSAESADKAIEEVQGFEIFGKEMRLERARTRSDAWVEKTEGKEGLEKWKRVRGGEKGKILSLTSAAILQSQYAFMVSGFLSSK
jgi:RNA recognition motif-containing protein